MSNIKVLLNNNPQYKKSEDPGHQRLKEALRTLQKELHIDNTPKYVSS